MAADRCVSSAASLGRVSMGMASMGMALAFAACAGAPAVSAVSDPARERADVEAVLRAYETAYNTHDSKALAAVHADDGGYYMASGAPVIGREALERFWARSAGKDLVLVLEKHDVHGDVGFAVGRWTTGDPAAGGGAGRFVLGLRRDAAGGFRIVVDLNNEAPRR